MRDKSGVPSDYATRAVRDKSGGPGGLRDARGERQEWGSGGGQQHQQHLGEVDSSRGRVRRRGRE